MSSSPVSQLAQAQEAPSQDPIEWPFEQFPPPPPDGYWIMKSAPPPPSKFPPLLPNIPSRLILDPPIMEFNYPPPPPLTLEDPAWLNHMVTDVMRQRAHLEMCLSEAQTDAVNAYVEAGLADAELEEERSKMQAFLNMVASVAGNGFIQRMLEDVEHSVEVMSRPQGDDEGECGSPPSSPSASTRTVHGPAI